MTLLFKKKAELLKFTKAMTLYGQSTESRQVACRPEAALLIENIHPCYMFGRIPETDLHMPIRKGMGSISHEIC